ncbi:hypothetical protein GCM10009836_01730 [Pseudonocardia ailaonensis]|uniref:Leucine-binding protein domain-containing protein n=1 Tax=Pseudonocardia ailaonensis TaxID=367279 RepID=A0ABN2MHX1_9PSEU
MRTRAKGLMAMAVVVAAAVSGCATGGSGGSSGGQTSAEPIVLYAPIPLTGSRQYYEIVAGANAAAAAINKAGGVKGRQIEIKSCDTKSDPTQEAACAQDILKTKATAVISQASGRSTAIADVTNENKIASIGGLGFGSLDLLKDSVAAFNLTTGPTAPMTCPAGLGGDGRTTFGAMVTDLASGALIAQAAETATKAVPGTTWAKTIKVLPEATDVAGLFQTALDSKVNGLVLAGSTTQLVGVVQANNNRIGLCGPDSLTVDALTKLGPAGNTWIGMSSTPPVDIVRAGGGDGVLFADDMAAYGASSNDKLAAEPAWRYTTLTGWMSVRAFQRVAEKIDGDISQKSVFDAFTKTTDLRFPGLLPSPVDFTKFQPIPAFARVFVPEYTAYKWDATKKHFASTGTTANLITLLSKGQ